MPEHQSPELNSWIKVTLINFAIAAIMGLLLRLAFIVELDWIDFKHMRHGHSHVALLGWLYLAFYSLIWFLFIPSEHRIKSKYSRLFWFTQSTVVGMMVSFPVQGYGLFSIIFSTLHILASYVFAFFVWRHIESKNRISGLFLRTAIIWMLISTLGVWDLGPVMILHLKNSILYHMSIQFFLHFQFNGWFTFGALAILFKLLSDQSIEIHYERFRLFYFLMVVSCILTFALAVTWSSPEDTLFFLNGAGVLMQLAALVAGAGLLSRGLQQMYRTSQFPVKVFFSIALISFILKILVQACVVIPQIAVISYTIRQFVIGFIHLTMLGSISCFIIGVLIQKKLIGISHASGRSGAWIFIAGFILTEALLFIQGNMLWAGMGFMPFYYEIIFTISIFLPFGLLLILAENIKGDKHHMRI
jgi:hypothetical protein